MKRIILSFVLTVALLFSFGFKGCTKAQKNAACNDISDGFRLESTQFPKDKVLAELKTDSVTICDIFASGGSVPVALVKAFLTRFDAFVQAHGQSEALGLIDIGIHVILNHLPTSVAAQSESIQDTDAIIQEYRNRPIWGCQFRPDKCH